MDAKIIRVINKMVQNSQLISDVGISVNAPNEFYFLYDKKSTWSILYKGAPEEDYILYFYPTKVTISQLIEQPIEVLNFLSYRATDFKSKEVDESFAELYSVVKGKLYGIDQVLDDILGEK